MHTTKDHDNVSVYEASEYWDNHDFDEDGDYNEVRDFQFNPRKKRFVGIDLALYADIVKKSKQLQVNEEALIHRWLQEKAAS